HPHGDAHAHADANAYRDPHANTDADAHLHAYREPQPDADAHPYADTVSSGSAAGQGANQRAEREAAPLARAEASQHDVEDGHESHGEEGGGEHAAEDDGAEGLLARASGAAGGQQR